MPHARKHTMPRAHRSKINPAEHERPAGALSQGTTVKSVKMSWKETDFPITLPNASKNKMNHK